MNKAIFRETKLKSWVYFVFLKWRFLCFSAWKKVQQRNSEFITLHKRAINVYRCDFITNTRAGKYMYVGIHKDGRLLPIESSKGWYLGKHS